MEFRASKWNPYLYFFNRYSVTPEAVKKTTGWLSKRHGTVPTDRITNVDVNIVWFPGMSSIGVNTGAGQPLVLNMLTQQTAREAAEAINELIPGSGVPPSTRQPNS